SNIEFNPGIPTDCVIGIATHDCHPAPIPLTPVSNSNFSDPVFNNFVGVWVFPQGTNPGAGVGHVNLIVTECRAELVPVPEGGSTALFLTSALVAFAGFLRRRKYDGGQSSGRS